jgi:RES domain-containing protein
MEIDSEDRPEHFRLLRIEGPDSLSVELVAEESLPQNWETDVTSTQAFGDRWLIEKRSPLLQVPSVLVPETWNLLVNPQHEQVSLLQTTKTYHHRFDRRLF